MLVCEDMLGMLEGHTPKFVKKYAHLAGDIDHAAAAYAADVRTRKFPSAEHIYTRPKEVKSNPKLSS